MLPRLSQWWGKDTACILGDFLKALRSHILHREATLGREAEAVRHLKDRAIYLQIIVSDTALNRSELENRFFPDILGWDS